MAGQRPIIYSPHICKIVFSVTQKNVPFQEMWMFFYVLYIILQCYITNAVRYTHKRSEDVVVPIVVHLKLQQLEQHTDRSQFRIGQLHRVRLVINGPAVLCQRERRLSDSGVQSGARTGLGRLPNQTAPGEAPGMGGRVLTANLIIYALDRCPARRKKLR